MVVASTQRTSARAGFVPLGVHLVGSVPLPTAAEVFSTLGAGLGDRLRRLPDGETGPRADWIVWQYPVLSSRPSFEVAPPAPHSYRALPRLRLRRDGEARRPRVRAARLRRGGRWRRSASSPRSSATASCREAAGSRSRCRRRSRPSAPSSRSTTRPSSSPPTSARCSPSSPGCWTEIPHDQLALQWDTNFEFGMLEGDVPAWFPDVRGGILERLLRISRLVPPAVELGFHFCSGHDEARPRTCRATWAAWSSSRTRSRPASSGRSAGCTCPCARGAHDEAFFAPLARPPAPGGDGALPRAAPSRRERRRDATAAIARRRTRADTEFGVATPCGWGRLPPARRRRARRGARGVEPPRRRPVGRAAATCSPGRDGFERVPDEEWVEAARRRVRPPLRHGREPRLVPQPRPHGRAARGGPAGRRRARSTTRAGRGSCSTGSGCASSTARWGW